MMKIIKVPLTKSIRTELRAGQEVLFTGTFYTARDQAHKRIAETLKRRSKPPVNLKDIVIYYCGPTPYHKRNMVGSAGPTTSARMDAFAPSLLRSGVGAMVGKGNRSHEVIEAIKKAKAVYFITIGGAGAYLAKRINRADIIAYKDLGPEAIHRLEVKDFPLIVAIDSRGKNIYTMLTGRG